MSLKKRPFDFKSGGKKIEKKKELKKNEEISFSFPKEAKMTRRRKMGENCLSLPRELDFLRGL